MSDNIRYLKCKPSPPFLVNYAITLRCNLDCKYCGVSRLTNNFATEELTYKDIAEFLEDRLLKKLKVVVISGGEPFLKEDFNEILLAFYNAIHPKIFHITTNGFLSEYIVDSVKFLKKSGLHLQLKVSIDDIASKHDALRNRQGSFEKAINTISRLRSNFNKRDLHIGINQTIYEENFRSIPKVRKLAKDFDASYVGFIGLKKRPLYRDESVENYNLVSFNRESKKYLRKKLNDVYDWRYYFGNHADLIEKFILKHYMHGQLRLLEGRKMDAHRCMSLFTYFRLNPNGDIITCSYDLDKLGNIRQEKYSSILARDIAKEKLVKVRDCGKCWLGCEVSPSWVSSLFMS
jgi:MoaA/NifB/PqqE/SkfB family radical SAM enzyme